MPDRLDRLEEIAATLLENARLVDQRLERHENWMESAERQLQILRDVARENNERMSALISAIGNYIRVREEERGSS